MYVCMCVGDCGVAVFAGYQCRCVEQGPAGAALGRRGGGTLQGRRGIDVCSIALVLSLPSSCMYACMYVCRLPEEQSEHSKETKATKDSKETENVCASVFVCMYVSMQFRCMYVCIQSGRTNNTPKSTPTVQSKKGKKKTRIVEFLEW